MYAKFSQSVCKGCVEGYKWYCKACSSPAAEHSEWDYENEIWVITRIKCHSCGNVWRKGEKSQIFEDMNKL
jgi:RNase P subunit RPR2